MPYNKTKWVDGGSPGISAPNLNNLETQYDAVKAEVEKTDGASDIKPQAINIQIQDTSNSFAAANVEDALEELAGNVSAGKSALASAVTDMGQAAQSTETFVQLASKVRAISTDATAAVGDVLADKTFYQGGAKRTGTMPDRGAITITPGTADQAIDQGYHSGAGKVLGDADLAPENIKTGVNLFGVAGSFTSDATAVAGQVLSGRTAYVNGARITGTMADQGAKVLSPGTSNVAIPCGYHSGSGYVQGDADLVPANIKKDISIFGVTGAAYVNRFGKYSVMRLLCAFRGAESSYAVIASRLSSDGLYLATCSQSKVYLYKCSTDSWSKVSEVSVSTGTIRGLSSWSADDTYLLVSGDNQGSTGCNVNLVKRTGDSLSIVHGGQISSYSQGRFVTHWDPSSTYVMIAGDLLKRSGDVVSKVSNTSGFTSTTGPDKNLEYMADAARLLKRTGDSVSVVNSNTGVSADPKLMSGDGLYVLVTPNASACLYKRDGNSLTLKHSYGTTLYNTTLGDTSLGANPASKWVDDVYPAAMYGSYSNPHLPLVSFGIDRANEKLRIVTAWISAGMAQGYLPSGAKSADYSLNGNYVAVLGVDDYVYLFRVGEEP